MGQPITTTGQGMCFAFPDVCLTPAPPGPPVPVPYPNIGQLADTQKTSDGSQGTGRVEVGGNFVVLEGSEIPVTTGDEAGSNGGVSSGTTKGKVRFTSFSSTVQIHGQGVVRMFDQTMQNNDNAQGTVLGGVPYVLVGG